MPVLLHIGDYTLLTLHYFSISSKHSKLSGNQWGGLEKIQRLKMATMEGIIPYDYSSNYIRAASVRDDKLLNDWNFDMDA